VNSKNTGKNTRSRHILPPYSEQIIDSKNYWEIVANDLHTLKTISDEANKQA